jgi:hypothetical protein
LVLPPTLLMGFSFPLLQRVVQTSLTHIGRRVFPKDEFDLSPR